MIPRRSSRLAAERENSADSRCRAAALGKRCHLEPDIRPRALNGEDVPDLTGTGCDLRLKLIRHTALQTLQKRGHYCAIRIAIS